MTSRFEPTSILLKAFLAEPAIFGEPVTTGAEPALSLGSVHHLLKVVAVLSQLFLSLLALFLLPIPL